nr:nuclear fusion defective 4 [Fagopyrum tataricum]
MAVSFIRKLLLGRWYMMFGAFLIMAGAGATYLFGVYSKEIKSTLGYDQSTLNLMGTFKDLGANVGVLSGLIAEVVPIPVVLIIGSLMNFFGYFMIWLAVTGRIAKPSVTMMCLYICVGANSQNFANTGSLVTCVKNFPQGRGMMLGLLKGYVGLSGAVFTQLYHAIYGDDAKSLILLIGWLPAILSILFIFNMKIMEASRHPRETVVFYQYLFVSVLLALTAMALTIVQRTVNFSRTAYIGSAVLVCFWLFLPFVIAVREEHLDWKQRKKEESNPKLEVVVKEEVEKSTKEESVPVPCYGSIFKKPPRGEDYSILQALLSVDMIILFLGTFCGLGCSLTAVDNLGQIGESLGYPTKTVSTFVSLVSIWNYFGRVFARIHIRNPSREIQDPKTTNNGFSTIPISNRRHIHSNTRGVDPYTQHHC